MWSRTLLLNFGHASENGGPDKFLTSFVNPDDTTNVTLLESLTKFPLRPFTRRRLFPYPRVDISVPLAVTYISWRSWRIKRGNRGKSGVSLDRTSGQMLRLATFPSTLYRNGPPCFIFIRVFGPCPLWDSQSCVQLSFSVSLFLSLSLRSQSRRAGKHYLEYKAGSLLLSTRHATSVGVAVTCGYFSGTWCLPCWLGLVMLFND